MAKSGFDDPNDLIDATVDLRLPEMRARIAWRMAWEQVAEAVREHPMRRLASRSAADQLPFEIDTEADAGWRIRIADVRGVFGNVPREHPAVREWEASLDRLAAEVGDASDWELVAMFNSMLERTRSDRFDYANDLPGPSIATRDRFDAINDAIARAWHGNFRTVLWEVRDAEFRPQAGNDTQLLALNTGSRAWSGFYLVPCGIFEDWLSQKKIRPSAALIFSVLHAIRDKENRARRSLSQLNEMTGLDRSAISRALRELEQVGLLSRLRNSTYDIPSHWGPNPLLCRVPCWIVALRGLPPSAKLFAIRVGGLQRARRGQADAGMKRYAKWLTVSKRQVQKLLGKLKGCGAARVETRDHETNVIALNESQVRDRLGTEPLEENPNESLANLASRALAPCYHHASSGGRFVDEGTPSVDRDSPSVDERSPYRCPRFTQVDLLEDNILEENTQKKEEEGENDASRRDDRGFELLEDDPGNLKLTPAMRNIASRHGLNPESTFQDFLDHALMNDRHEKNWLAAFERWCRKEPEFAAARAESRRRNESLRSRA